jgi:hypothetical protein
MARSVYQKGGDAEVLIIPKNTEIIETRGMTDVTMKGGVEIMKVQTEFGDIEVVKDPYCPPDKWYLVDWLFVERVYKQTQRDFPFFSMGQLEEKVVERLDAT